MTDEKQLIYPKQLYFTITLDGYWRLIFINDTDMYPFATAVYLDNKDAHDLMGWLERGDLGQREIEGDIFTAVLKPSFDNPLYWNVITDKPKRWHRRLGRGRSTTADKEEIVFSGEI